MLKTCLARRLTTLLFATSVTAGVTTVTTLIYLGPNISSTSVLIFLITDLVLLLLLCVTIVQHVTMVWKERRRGSTGSRLHVRFIVLFSMIAVIPTILVTAFFVLFFNIWLEAWFRVLVQIISDTSDKVAQAHITEHRQTIVNDVQAMAAFFDNAGQKISEDRELFASLLTAQAIARDLSEAVVFKGSGEVLAQTGYTYSLYFEEIPQEALQEARTGKISVLTTGNDRVRALVKLSGSFYDTYLYAGHFINTLIISHAERTQFTALQYHLLEGRRSDLQITFSTIFIIAALLILLSSIRLGLFLATKLARPIVSLVNAAEKMGSGHLDVRVELQLSSDEVSTLVRAFNHMAVQISIQQQALMQANRAMDERRRFTEIVLSGVTAGVIGMDDNANIHLPNPSASDLLECDLEALVGHPVVEAWPELTDLVEKVRHCPDHLLETEIHCIRSSRARVFLVRLAAENLEEQVVGYVLTFDDITELQLAQRKAAWADVARRIAHEIKNPLTPIQLSAERLKRKYLDQITTDQKTFAVCTDTIVRQVSDIRRMVNEFSEFARMPSPLLIKEDLGTLVSTTLSLQRMAFPDLLFLEELPNYPVLVFCDSGQIGRVLTNLFQNAVEAIEACSDRPLSQGCIMTHIIQTADHVIVTIVDNGKGLPVENRAQLTEPYVTTRISGTGLGLSIVKKIMEDHNGQFSIEDAGDTQQGVRVSLVFPKCPEI